MAIEQCSPSSQPDSFQPNSIWHRTPAEVVARWSRVQLQLSGRPEDRKKPIVGLQWRRNKPSYRHYRVQVNTRAQIQDLCQLRCSPLATKWEFERPSRMSTNKFGLERSILLLNPRFGNLY